MAAGSRRRALNWVRTLDADNPFIRSTVGSLLLGLVLVGVSLAIASLTPNTSDAVIYFLILIIAVVGMGIFCGNSGILSYGHVAFIGLGAYTYALVTLDPGTKSATLPDLPSWLAGIGLDFVPGLAVTLVFIGVIAFASGILIARLPPYSASLATFGLWISVNAILLGATSYTRGAQTFYGVDPLSDVRVVMVCALVAIWFARWFRESVWGLRLRASREDPLAADAMGVDIWRVRLLSWTLSGVVTATAGVLLARWLTSFAPKDFSLNLTFTLVAMLIIGGSSTTLGQVGGTALIAVATYALRPLENGVDVGPISTPAFYGLAQLVTGLAILVILYRRPQGLLGRLELDELLVSWSSRRRRTLLKHATGGLSAADSTVFENEERS